MQLRPPQLAKAPPCLNGREHDWRDQGGHVICRVCWVAPCCGARPGKHGSKIRALLRDDDVLDSLPRAGVREGTVAKLLRARDGDTCHYCGRWLAPGLGTRDHVVPVSRGGPNFMSNSVLSCGPCNAKKGDRDAAEFLASAWLAERRRVVEVCALYLPTGG